jgi:hypothetical protein
MPIVIEAIDVNSFKNWLITWIPHCTEFRLSSNYEKFYFETLLLSHEIFSKYVININNYF